jgi:polysaccharide biosynthesis/export protein
MRRISAVILIVGLFLAASGASAQTAPPKPPEAAKVAPASPKQAEQATQAPPAKAGQKPAQSVVAPAVPPPPGFVIGPEDVLNVEYWREANVSKEVTVRPDGMISLPLLNDVQAAGLTPEQLRDRINELAKKYFEDPNVTVTVKMINSRKAFITGQVTRPGSYPLTAPTTVLQLISMAGGLSEFAKQKDISVMRVENGKQLRFPFNYKDVAKGKNLQQNIELKPGDTVIVP